ncbi:hypothetical protein NDS46_31350 (plasmid) [Paenibacillus thiaminolyticus]|uniref:hypothetical protein n=1 Tax=Paenibacillus thiaminolyticus TaxID=49283 RepID=UPI00232F0F83|nr:hypothetical protein [Paenibacillus thiaminolyticus]WCF11455.1 hypothetical protein NDS46_31350 [Paenibacillus thiaminolyticus]
MIRNALGYVFGIAVLGGLMALGVSLLLNVLPYAAVTFLVLVPFWGAYRQQKHWTHEYFGLKTWFRAFWKVFKFGKPNLTFYLILGVTIGFTYEQVGMMLALTLGYIVGGIVATCIVWESVRLALNKSFKVEVISFGQAMKSAWI